MLPPAPPALGRRIVICDYTLLLQSITGLLRLSGYAVFQAFNGQAAAELCSALPDVELLVLNTVGTDTDTPTLIRSVRAIRPGMPVLHIGNSVLAGMPADIPTLAESFTADQLLEAVRALLPAGEPTDA